MKQLLLVSLILPYLALSAMASNINAASCSTSDVQAAVNSASSGDTVNVPAGTCSYSSAVTVSNKSLTIQGQTSCSGTPPTVGSCTDRTILQDNSGSNGAIFIVTNNAPNFVTIKNFTCSPCGDTSGSFEMLGPGTGNFDVTFRITGNHFMTTASRAVIPVGTYGLIDHNLFDSPTSGLQSISIHGSTSGSDQGFTPWTQPFTPGTSNAVYIEDNTFNYSSGAGDDAIDAYDGARLVIRYNTFFNEHFGFHGTDSGGRSPVLWEIYHNTLTNNTSATFDMVTVRGGTGFVWGNTYTTGSGGHGFANVALKLYRACPGSTYGAWGTCDGTHWGLESMNHSSNLATVASTSGPAFFCSQDRDKQCQTNSDCGGSNTCSKFMDDTSGLAGYSCRDQPGRGPSQLLDPVYLWANAGGNGAVADDTGLACGVGIGNYIAANREYYNFDTSFTASSGTGQGLLSARPSTCTPLVAYFATDNSTLYQCTSPNTWTVYYTPYTYPDPLQGGAPPPAPPSNLNATVQ